MSGHGHKSNYEKQLKEWAHEQEQWSKALDKHFQRSSGDPGHSASLLVTQDTPYWEKNTLQEWDVGNQASGSQNIKGGEQNEFPKYSEGSRNQEIYKFGGSQQQFQSFGESQQQEKLYNFSGSQQQPHNFKECQQQEPTDQSELNEHTTNNVDPPSPPRHTTAESSASTPSASDSQSPKPINLEKYLPHLNTPTENLTPQEREDMIQFRQDVMTMHNYNQHLLERKEKEQAEAKKNKGKGKSVSTIEDIIQNNYLYDPENHVFDPTALYEHSAICGHSAIPGHSPNKRKRVTFEISDDKGEEEGREGQQQQRQQQRLREQRDNCELILQQEEIPGFEEWREKNLAFDPYNEYTLRKGEIEPPTKRVKASTGGRPVRPPPHDSRWNIWTVGDPTLKLKGSNVSAEYLRRVLYEDAGASGERRTKWSLPRLCARLLERREFREKEARKMGAGAKPVGKPDNWSPENPWWNYFDV